MTKTLRRLAEDAKRNPDSPTRDFLADMLTDAADVIDDLRAQKKAAAKRIVWIPSSGQYVARVGRSVYTLTGARLGLMRTAPTPVVLGYVTSIEAASRRIRAYRAGKWKG